MTEPQPVAITPEATAQAERWARHWQATQVFTPGAPIDKFSLFAGRSEQVREVLDAVGGRGQHAILFGERGVGKTSLVNVLSDILQTGGFKMLESGSINCASDDTFTSLWSKVFRELFITVPSPQMGFDGNSANAKVTLERLLPDPASPEDIRHIISRNLSGSNLIVLDEVDRIKDRSVTGLLADTIKTLSDHSINTTIVLVGVADSVDELIAEHRSIERALVQVRMPRMSHAELIEIIDKGLNVLHMTIVDEAKSRIARLSQGLPHYTHVFAQYASQRGIAQDRTEITNADVDHATKQAVEKAQRSVLTAYDRATTSQRRGNLYAQVLLACALAQTDNLGYFAPADVRGPLSRIMSKRYDIPAFVRHLTDFCSSERGPALQRTGSPWNYRFRFAEPLMQPFIILHGLANGMLTEATLREFRP